MMTELTDARIIQALTNLLVTFDARCRDCDFFLIGEHSEYELSEEEEAAERLAAKTVLQDMLSALKDKGTPEEIDPNFPNYSTLEFLLADAIGRAVCSAVQLADAFQIEPGRDELV